jgi:hypothetical protein
MGRRFALIIGNSDYQDANLARLVTPGKDVSALVEVLRNPRIGGFDEVTALVNESGDAIRRAIARFFDKKKRDDLLLLYFSGHGVRDDHGNLHLAVNDTEHDLLSGTAIPAAFITEEMDHSHSRRQVLILDCCHSGAFARGAKRGGLGTSAGTGVAFEGTGYGRVVLTATDSIQYAWEGDQVIGKAENSVFTHYLIQGLRTGEADANDDGWVTLDELYDYVYGQVVNETPRQTPGKWTYGQQGEIIIAQNPLLVEPRTELPLKLQEAIGSPFARARVSAVRKLDRLLRSSDEDLSWAAYAALQRLAQDPSRRVSTLATASLASCAKEQPVLIKGKRSGSITIEGKRSGSILVEGKRSGSISEKTEAEAGTRPTLGGLLLKAVGWAVGWVVGLLPLAILGGLLWEMGEWAGAIGGGIGGLVTGLVLHGAVPDVTWRQVLTCALGWSLGWAVGGAISLAGGLEDFGWVIAGAIVGALGAGAGLVWGHYLLKGLRRAVAWVYGLAAGLVRLIRETPVWTYGRLATLILLLLGFFGPWTLTECSGPPTPPGEPETEPPPPEIKTGVDHFTGMLPLIAPLILLFVTTLLRLGPLRVRSANEVIWLERIGAAASLIGVGFLTVLLSVFGRVLWGLWTTVAGVLVALLNLIGERVAPRIIRRWRR